MINLDNPSKDQAERLLKMVSDGRKLGIKRISENLNTYIENAKKACDTIFTGDCPACGSDLIHEASSVNLYQNFICESCSCLVKIYPLCDKRSGKIAVFEWYEFGVRVHDGEAFKAKWDVVF